MKHSKDVTHQHQISVRIQLEVLCEHFGSWCDGTAHKESNDVDAPSHVDMTKKRRRRGSNATMGAVLTRLLEVFYTKKLDIVVIGLENRYASFLLDHASCSISRRHAERSGNMRPENFRHIMA